MCVTQDLPLLMASEVAMPAGATPRGSTKGRARLRIGMTSHHRIGCIYLDLHYKNRHKIIGQ